MSVITIPSLATHNPVSFQGAIYLAKLSSGVRQPLWWVGNSPKASLAPAVERRRHRESYSGNRQIDRTRVKSRDAKLTLTLEDINKDNIAVGLLGKKVTTAGGSITNEAMPTMAVGGIYHLKYPNASSIALTDSAGAPAPLTLNTHYKVLNAKTGLIEILSLGSLTQPFKCAYTAAAVSVITGMEGDDADEYFLFCDLLNTEPSTDQAIGLEIYRCQIDPTALLELINEEGGSFDIVCDVLRENTLATDAEFGGYFRWIYNDANV